MALHWNLTQIKNQDKNCWFTVSPEILGEEAKERAKDKKDGKIRVNMFGAERQNCEDGSTREMKATTNMLIWLLGFTVGFHEISKENCLKVFNRISLLEKMNGAYLIKRFDNGKTKGFKLTLQEVKRHIGLHTNGSRLTKNQFLKRVFKEEIL